MILEKYENLPPKMQNEKVKKYYDILIKKQGNLFFKRIFDIIMSLILLILLSPIIIILSIIIKIDSKGPIFYKQERVTTNGRKFKIFKFRTMVQNADKIGSLVTVGNDCRITKVGKAIRKVRLDELPQLINVLIGDMSFVGTRPEVQKYVDYYTEDMEATLLMPAGITSIASIKYKDEDTILEKAVKNGKNTDNAYVEEVLPEKMKYNLEYLEKFNMWYDVKVCVGTIIGVLK